MNIQEIKEHVLSLKVEEVTLDELIEKNFDRTLVIAALKSMQQEELGKFIVGRRGAKSRFVFGLKVDEKLSKKGLVLASVLEKTVKEKLDSGQNIIINVQDLTKNSAFDSSDVVLAFKKLELEGLGMFIIGRRGAQSRFEVGRKRDEKKEKISGSEYDLPPPEDGPFSKGTNDVVVKEIVKGNKEDKYFVQILNDCAFLALNNCEGYDSVFDAVKNCDMLLERTVEDKKIIEDNLIRFGIYDLKNEFSEDKGQKS